MTLLLSERFKILNCNGHYVHTELVNSCVISHTTLYKEKAHIDLKQAVDEDIKATSWLWKIYKYINIICTLL